MVRLHRSPEPVRPVNENISVVVVAPEEGPTKSQYAELEMVLSPKEFYDPFFLNDISPKDRYQRRHWMDNVHIQFPVMLYKFAFGASIGTLCFAWRVPDEVDQTEVSRTIAKITAKQKIYATRAMKSDLLDKYSRLSKTPKAVLRNMFKSR